MNLENLIDDFDKMNFNTDLMDILNDITLRDEFDTNKDVITFFSKYCESV